MKIKKILIILSFFILSGCGYEPIYSKKNLENGYNFTISSIIFLGEDNINVNLKNDLINYINIETKPIKYDLVINSSISKTITSKNKKGNPEVYYTKITINVEIQKAGQLIKNVIFDEGFEYKNKSNKFELKKYEKNIQKNLSSELSKNLIHYLYLIKW